MKLIVCLDQNNGILFNRRRQSRDRTVAEHIMQHLEDCTLWMHPYSAPLFADYSGRIKVEENFLQLAAPEDCCFLENVPPPAAPGEVIVYRWDRRYPADTHFDLKDLRLVHTEEFRGFSHTCITREVYVP